MPGKCFTFSLICGIYTNLYIQIYIYTYGGRSREREEEETEEAEGKLFRGRKGTSN